MSDFGETSPGAMPPEAIIEKPKTTEADDLAGSVASKTEPDSNIEQTKKELVDPRTISKKTDPEGRTETARNILEARSSKKATGETISEHEARMQQISELTSSSYTQERQKAKELTQRLEAVLVRAKKLIGIGDKQATALQAEIAQIKSERDELYAESYTLEDELKALRQQDSEIPTPKQLLEAYYEEKSTTPLTNEQKRELLKPEVLASLSEEQYIALWKRLNPHFLSHVTRQGFRDHTGGDVMVDHRSGYKEFVNGFVDVMENGRAIFPPLARIGLVDRDEETVRSFLSPFLEEVDGAEEAKEKFMNFLNWGLASAPKYPDITATHLAAQIVSDRYYGGEHGNEVFFIYPSDILASQYPFAFNGWEKDFTEPQSEVKWNDVFIWTDPGKPGVPVDSGIVFLSRSTPVDPETGSKYASELRVVDGQEKRVMVKDDALVGSFVEWGEKIDDESPLRKAFTAYKEERHYYRQQDLKESCLRAFVQELQSLGFQIDASTSLANKLMGEMHWKDSFDEKALREIAESAGADLKRAEETVSAQEYWTTFFDKNPNLRPKHVHYYDGNPTTAVFEFQQQNGIGKADTSDTEGQLLGFDDNHVVDMGEDPRANSGYDELVATATKIIEEHYKTE